MSNNADSLQFLAVVATMHHERVGEPFNDGAVGFAEPLSGIAACRVGNVDGRPNLDVVAGSSVKNFPPSVKTIDVLEYLSPWQFVSSRHSR